MEYWIQQYEAVLSGIGAIILGVLILLFIKYYEDMEEVRIYEDTSSTSQVNKFGLYLMSGVEIVGGIFIFLRELFS